MTTEILFGKKYRASFAVISTLVMVSCQPLSPSEEADQNGGKKSESDDQTKRDTPPQLTPHDTTPTQTPTPTAPANTPTIVVPLHLDATEASMRNDLIANLCLSCHQTATSINRYVDLTDITALITTGPDTTPAGRPRKIVRAGCPTLSMFYLSVKNAQMPKDPTKVLSVTNVAAVEKWIHSLNPDPTLVCSDEPPD